MYYSICYLSKAKESLTEDELNDLFSYTAQYNNECDITGILLHSIGRFFQVLEGKEEDLLALYSKIKKDNRHEELFELFSGRTAHPLFVRYNSKFNVVKSTQDLNRIKEYLDANKSHPRSERMQRILEPFLLMGME